MKTQTLEQRAVGALTAEPPPSAAALLTLIAEVETGIAEAEAAAETAQQAFLDPIQSPDINAARAKVEATQFVGTRLRSLLVRLESRYREVAAAEARAEWRSKYEALERERDALAKELREVYPTAAPKLHLFLEVLSGWPVQCDGREADKKAPGPHRKPEGRGTGEMIMLVCHRGTDPHAARGIGPRRV